jgi:NAD-dependent SIR2 family protein deacetylase
MISELHARFRRHFCPQCRTQAYGHINGMTEAVRNRNFRPCAACERVIERILRMEIVEESAL